MKHLSKRITAAMAGIIFLCVLNFSSASSTVIVYEAPAKKEIRIEYKIPPVETLAVVSTTTPHEFEIFSAQISAYTSSADETDDTPDVNAMGRKPGPGSIACPARYVFGTKVFIRDEVYFCDDRMNGRYSGGDYFDIWMSSKAEAIHWGRRTVEVKVVQ